MLIAIIILVVIVIALSIALYKLYKERLKEKERDEFVYNFQQEQFKQFVDSVKKRNNENTI